MYRPKVQSNNNLVPIDISQNEFSKAYISTISNSRRPLNSLSDMTNMEITQDNIPRPRPPLVQYGTQPDNPIIGRGEYRYNGNRGLLFMMRSIDFGFAQIYKQEDGGAFTLVGGTNTYDDVNWAGFVQSKNKVYVFNGVNSLTYINLSSWATVEYSYLGSPAAPSGSASANLTSGTRPYNYYYRVTASNAVGESAASNASAAVNVNDIRDNWSADSSIAKTVTVTWSAPAVGSGITAYTIYGGDDPNNLYEIITLSATLTTLSFVDDGSYTLNPYKKYPEGNSTEGPVFNWMYVDSKNAQLFGITFDNKLYYSAPGTGDFSGLNGGGWVTIDEGGDTELNFVDGFRTGKGDPVITCSSRGSAGKGKLFHITFETATYGDQVITFPNITEANGQSGTYSPRATVKVRDALIYPTGDAIKTTGTSQNVVNILTTHNLSSMIEPDINQLSLGSLHKAVGVEYQDRVYFSLPVGSTENNQIWYIDMARKNAWVLRWLVPANDLWLYEDNNGYSHLCALVGNKILEFTRIGSSTTNDDGVPFLTRCAFSSLTWDKDGLILGNINKQHFKFLQPKGNIQINTFGLTKRGATVNTGMNTYSIETSFTGYGEWDYSGDYKYGDDPGQIDSFAQSVAVVSIRPKGLLNQANWEIITEKSGCDYLLSTVNTRGTANKNLIYKTM